MASIENRSRIHLTVKNRDDLTKDFARNADKAIQRYIQTLWNVLCLSSAPPLCPNTSNVAVVEPASTPILVWRRHP